MSRLHRYFNKTVRRSVHLGRQSFRNLAFKHYGVANAYMALSAVPMRQKKPILIYQMGKVGSTTIARALKKSSLHQPVYKVHTLSPNGLKESIHHYRILEKQLDAFSWERAKHVFESKALAKHIRRNKKDETWKIITMTRDPIARNISSFFQVIDFYVPNFSQKLSSGLITIDSLEDIFFAEYDHSYPLNWFKHELNRTFKINIFNYPFDQNKGYSVYKKNNIELLVIKMECMENCLKEAIEEFLHIEMNVVEGRNMADQKNYHEVYRAFKNHVRFPDEYIHHMYHSQYMTHFYQDDEIRSFKSKWMRTDNAILY